MRLRYEPAHDKTYSKNWVTSKDSDQSVHPPSMAGVIFHPSSDNPESVQGTCDQRRLWLDCAYAQADLSLRWSHKCYCMFCRAMVHIIRCIYGVLTCSSSVLRFGHSGWLCIVIVAFPGYLYLYSLCLLAGSFRSMRFQYLVIWSFITLLFPDFCNAQRTVCCWNLHYLIRYFMHI